MAPRYSLSHTDVILRGCASESPARLIESMRTHFASPFTMNEWGLSIATMLDASEVEVLKAARHLRQSHYRSATMQDFEGIGIDVLDVDMDEPRENYDYLHIAWDHNAHGLILNTREPSMELATAIANAFGPPKVNPYYEERRRSRASR